MTGLEKIRSALAGMQVGSKVRGLPSITPSESVKKGEVEPRGAESRGWSQGCRKDSHWISGRGLPLRTSDACGSLLSCRVLAGVHGVVSLLLREEKQTRYCQGQHGKGPSYAWLRPPVSWRSEGRAGALSKGRARKDDWRR